ncbi:hypothetical protein KAU51_03375 [Candidatus Parcubacteria bacterium]|nr:hypothetical protein [Candidatus Parcubacteria bacterium]
MNHQIASQKLSIDFKKPWNYIYNLSAEARGEATSEAKTLTNRLWWSILKEVRIYFENNFNAD